ncbi:helix-turn-helix domain-containing protein [Patulibacter brassicae]|jgi:excisionase family DNA binding protein|uniref:Helix-turn-helix domain-containing protein n=1 Tax=Patulibacter brassicae TaxID=1705717 RepID=A0ABU4VNC9_9ACTN|nr:helix-turn-helix domain-containing protein [Patulibacter brassicae]MDX8153358.1 helix-turn-helix domain-containing protein [Patulibacter brassicae]
MSTWPHDPPVRRWHQAPATASDEVDWKPAHATSGFSARDVMTVAEAASLLRCSERHIYNLVARDELPGARYLGRNIIIVRPVLVAWLLDGEPKLSS